MKRSLFMLLWFYSIVSMAQVIEIENPVFDRTNVPSMHIDKVEITRDTTFVHCTYSTEPNGWANISGETYIISYPSKEKHRLLSCLGLPLAPQKRTFPMGGKYEVVFIFPSIKGSSHFDFIESPDDKAFNIYGVDMSNQFEKQFTESELRRFSNMSSFYDTAGDTIKTIQNKKSEIQAIKYLYGIKSDDYFLNSSWLCDIFDKYGYYQDAIDLMKTLIRQKRNIWMSNIWDDAIITRKLAEYYSHAKLYEKSIETFKVAISKFESINSNDEQYACALGLLSDDYEAYGDEHNSILCRHKSLEIRKQLGDSEKYLEELGVFIIGLGQNTNKYERLEIAEKELANLPEFVDTTTYTYTNILKSMIQSYQMIDDYIISLKYCDRLLAILNQNKNENKIRIADVLGYKSINQYSLNNRDEAIFLGEYAINLFDSLHVQTSIYMTVLDYLKLAYFENYDYEKVISIAKHISSINEGNHDWLSLAKSLKIIGECYGRKEDLESAYLYAKKALDVINNHDNPDDYMEKRINGEEITHISIFEGIKNSISKEILSAKASYLSFLAEILWKRGNIEESIQLETTSGNIYLDMHDDPSYALHLLKLGNYYHKNHQNKEAISCAENSIIILRKYGKYNYSPSILDLSILYHEEGDITKAIAYAKDAVVVSKSFGDYQAMLNGLSFLFVLYYSINDYYKAEESLSEAIGYLQKKVVVSIVGMKTEQKQRLWRNSEFIFLAYRELLEKFKQDGDFVSKLYNYTLFSKSILLDSEERDINKFQNRTNVKWKEIQDKLTEQDISIEFISTKEGPDNKRYYALVIDKSCKYPVLLPLFYESDYFKIKQTNTENELEILGDLIWKPILKQYSTIRNIYFSPDGIIHLIPIEHSIVDGIGEMMEKYNIYRLSSTKEIYFQRENENNKIAILYGGLDYDMFAKESNNYPNEKEYSLLRSINARGGFDPLLSTLEEVNEIINLLNDKNVLATLYTGVDGTEDSFKKLSGKEVNILHLSTHGMYVGPNNIQQKKIEEGFNFLELITNENDPVKEDIVLTHSFLVMSGGNKIIRRETLGNVMSDGILTAFEISHVDLSNVDLVVLSACETGLGDVENSGVYGLQRGFKKAGVNTLLMSLDKVDDEATKILMVEFYKNLMNGKTKHQSLKDAQKYLRQVDNGKYNKPEYWASFIMLDGNN